VRYSAEVISKRRLASLLRDCVLGHAGPLVLVPLLLRRRRALLPSGESLLQVGQHVRGGGPERLDLCLGEAFEYELPHCIHVRGCGLLDGGLAGCGEHDECAAPVGQAVLALDEPTGTRSRQVCTIAWGQTLDTTSSKPLSPSQTTKNVSRMPRLRRSVSTAIQNFAPSPPVPAQSRARGCRARQPG
jgi:hypothetical protein